MYSLRQLILGVCFVAQFCAVALVSLFIAVMLSVRYDDIHSSRERYLTREEVISNVLTHTLNWSLAFTVLAAVIFFINHALLKNMDEINGKKAATIFSLICWLWMMFLVLYAGINCYLTYGANLPA